jgi:Arc/MetJ-type ribon-helix-helix transcriptional regulator
MADIERVTVTLPNELIRDIDRQEKNRSKFIAEAVRRELDRRRRAELSRSLQNPHAESVELAEDGEDGLDEWAAGLPEDDSGSLVDIRAGKSVRWVPGEGWLELDGLESGEKRRE